MVQPAGVSDSTKYRYGFNGKERDPEFQNNYDYGLRIYNPGLAKFLSVDPLTSSYPSLTPYQFASNNPVFNIDVDGLEGCISNCRMLRCQSFKFSRRQGLDQSKTTI
ncbi:MAG: RHS repeat-associated core domain-containing protein, partial [Bacteroidota bacterium]